MCNETVALHPVWKNPDRVLFAGRIKESTAVPEAPRDLSTAGGQMVSGEKKPVFTRENQKKFDKIC